MTHIVDLENQRCQYLLISKDVLDVKIGVSYPAYHVSLATLTSRLHVVWCKQLGCIYVGSTIKLYVYVGGLSVDAPLLHAQSTERCILPYRGRIGSKLQSMALRVPAISPAPYLYLSRGLARPGAEPSGKRALAGAVWTATAAPRPLPCARPFSHCGAICRHHRHKTHQNALNAE